MAEPKSSSPSLNKMADPKKRPPSLSATELLLMDSTSELEDPSGSSDPEKSGISSSGTESSTNSVVVTQNICDALSDGADSWLDEEDVLRAMASLSLQAK